MYVRNDRFNIHKKTKLNNNIETPFHKLTFILWSSNLIALLLKNAVKRHQAEHKFIGALYSASAKVLARNGLIGARQYVATAKLYQNFEDGYYIDQTVVQDEKLITGKDFGVAFDFVMTIGTNLLGERQQQTNNKQLIDVDWQAHHISDDKWFVTKKGLTSA